MTILYFFPIIFVIAVVYGAMRRETPREIAAETVKIFLKISIISVAGATVLYFLIRNM